MVGELDRLSRSLREVLAVHGADAEAAAGFRSLTEAIDTIVGALAEFEIVDAPGIKARLHGAREGRIGGRRPKRFPEQEAEVFGRWSPRKTKTAADVEHELKAEYKNRWIQAAIPALPAW